MSSDTDSEFEADSIKNGDLFQRNLATKRKDDKKTQDKKVEKGKMDSKQHSLRILKQRLRKIGRMTRFHY